MQQAPPKEGVWDGVKIANGAGGGYDRQRHCNDTNPTKITVMKYFIRSLKYFVALCVICVAILALMLATGTSALTLDQTVYVMFHTSRYATLFAAIVVLAALYPRFGFVVRKVEGDVEQKPRTDRQRLQVGRLFAARRGRRGDDIPRRRPAAQADAAGRGRNKGFTIRTVDSDRRHTPRRRPGRIPAGFVHTNE